MSPSAAPYVVTIAVLYVLILAFSISANNAWATADLGGFISLGIFALAAGPYYQWRLRKLKGSGDTPV